MAVKKTQWSTFKKTTEKDFSLFLPALYRGLYGEPSIDLTKGGSDGQEERQRKLIYELNTSGKYFAFKEQLKGTFYLFIFFIFCE